MAQAGTSTYTQARIRVNQTGALMLRDVLRREELRLLEAEGDSDEFEHRQMLRFATGEVRRMRDEVERTIKEMDW